MSLLFFYLKNSAASAIIQIVGIYALVAELSDAPDLGRGTDV